MTNYQESICYANRELEDPAVYTGWDEILVDTARVIANELGSDIEISPAEFNITQVSGYDTYRRYPCITPIMEEVGLTNISASDTWRKINFKSLAYKIGFGTGYFLIFPEQERHNLRTSRIGSSGFPYKITIHLYFEGKERKAYEIVLWDFVENGQGLKVAKAAREAIAQGAKDLTLKLPGLINSLIPGKDSNLK